MHVKQKSIWIVSREYAGIAEAGGVKNVTTSLAETLIKYGFDVKVFIPQYGCYETNCLQKYTSLESFYANISITDELYTVTYAQAESESESESVPIVFVKNHIFSSKNAVYTYTSFDEKINPLHRRGLGHIDSHVMNALFQKAVLEYALLQKTAPDIIHCQDAAASMLPVYAREDIRIKMFFKKTSFVVTIHNAGPGYHHAYSSIDDAYRVTNLPHHVLMYGLSGGSVEPFLLASKYAVLTTVSPWYAQEIIDPLYPFTDGLSYQFARRNITVEGILNAIDYDRYDPSDTSKSLLCSPYNPSAGNITGKTAVRSCFLTKTKKGIMGQTDHEGRISKIEQFGSLACISNTPVVFGYHGRIVWQKGLEILVHAARTILKDCEHACFIIIGQGQPEIEQMHIDIANEFEGRYVYIRGYERSLARECIASSDFLVLPSVFEPCGLEDFIGQIFGTLPIAHAVGGLNKIVHEQTGFLYHDNSPEGLHCILKHIYNLFLAEPDKITQMIKTAALRVREEFTWDAIVSEQYIPLYEEISKKNT